MCTRFVSNGRNKITGFNFDIDLSDWTHKIVKKKDCFSIGIKMPDNQYHSFHGVNKNGNVGTLLYVHGNENAQYCDSISCYTIADLTENFVNGKLIFDDALEIVKNKKIIYAPNATMQSMLSDKNGRVLIVEPGIGYKLEKERYSLITNYSILAPETTRPYILLDDDRYEVADTMLGKYGDDLSVSDAFSILKNVRMEGLWATRVSFVYSQVENKVYYTLNSDFENIQEYSFV
ncbi:TPA: conjugal transfer protein [Enterococcus faecium]